MSDSELALTTLIASLIASFIGGYPVAYFVHRQWVRVAKDFDPNDSQGESERHIAYSSEDAEVTDHEKSRYYARLMGYVERLVYTFAWMYGVPEGIGFILALKAVPQVRTWTEEPVYGRVVFNIWLMGNLISIIIAVSVAILARIVATEIVFK